METISIFVGNCKHQFGTPIDGNYYGRKINDISFSIPRTKIKVGWVEKNSLKNLLNHNFSLSLLLISQPKHFKKSDSNNLGFAEDFFLVNLYNSTQPSQRRSLCPQTWTRQPRWPCAVGVWRRQMGEKHGGEMCDVNMQKLNNPSWVIYDIQMICDIHNMYKC